MNQDASTLQRDRPDLGQAIRKRLMQLVPLVLIQFGLLFVAAGRLDWWQGWAYTGLYVGSILVNFVVLARYSPGTIVSRASAQGMKNWDKVIGGLLGLVGTALLQIVAGLDARLGWTAQTLSGGSIPLAVHLAGMGAFALGYALVAWAMVSNPYFSSMVRIQAEEGHTVASGGPYRFVRHPGYVGAIIETMAVPLILGTLWALIPAGLATLLAVVRTVFEDRMLRDELAGYKEYAQRVRCRLLPPIW